MSSCSDKNSTLSSHTATALAHQTALLHSVYYAKYITLHSLELMVMDFNEAKRNDKDYAYVAAWEYKGNPRDAEMHKEELEFNDIELKQRSYK